MAIREILLPLVSYPLAVEDAAIKKSVSVAAHLEAQITAVSFDVDIRSRDRPLFPTNGLTLKTPEQKQSLLSADHMMAVFDAAARACGVGFHKTITRCVREDFPSYLAYCARTFDISLVPVRPFDALHEKSARRTHLPGGTTAPDFFSRNGRSATQFVRSCGDCLGSQSASHQSSRGCNVVVAERQNSPGLHGDR
jgi:hypothetical protein